LKWNFVRTPTFDLAVDPGVQAFVLSDTADEGSSLSPHLLLTSPLVLGINAGPDFSVVPRVGIAYGFNTGGQSSNASFERVSTIDAAFLQAGVGLDFRVTGSFAIHPELSVLRSFSSEKDIRVAWYTFGIGINWGALPDY